MDKIKCINKRKREIMKRNMITLLLTLNFLFAYNYDVGEIISDSHQNVTQSTCYSGNEYTTGESWKLADWNGAINGGHHTVIFIEMSATW